MVSAAALIAGTLSAEARTPIRSARSGGFTTCRAGPGSPTGGHLSEATASGFRNNAFLHTPVGGRGLESVSSDQRRRNVDGVHGPADHSVFGVGSDSGQRRLAGGDACSAWAAAKCVGLWRGLTPVLVPIQSGTGGRLQQVARMAGAAFLRRGDSSPGELQQSSSGSLVASVGDSVARPIGGRRMWALQVQKPLDGRSPPWAVLGARWAGPAGGIQKPPLRWNSEAANLGQLQFEVCWSPDHGLPFCRVRKHPFNSAPAKPGSKRCFANEWALSQGYHPEG